MHDRYPLIAWLFVSPSCCPRSLGCRYSASVAQWWRNRLCPNADRDQHRPNPKQHLADISLTDAVAASEKQLAERWGTHFRLIPDQLCKRKE